MNFDDEELCNGMDDDSGAEDRSRELLETPMLSTVDLAVMLNVSIDSLDKGRRTHPEQLPPFVKIGRSVRYRLSDVMDWIEINLQGGGYGV